MQSRGMREIFTGHFCVFVVLRNAFESQGKVADTVVAVVDRSTTIAH